MSAKSSDAKAQFQAVDDLLTRWLKERRSLLGKYTELVVAIDGGLDAAQLLARQKRLCEILVDYISAGHFEVYNQLIQEAETFDDGSGDLAQQLMPAIGDTTEVLLAYEEKYAGQSQNTNLIERDVSALGEMLETRFVLEDRMIAGLHGRHRREIDSTQN